MIRITGTGTRKDNEFDFYIARIPNYTALAFPAREWQSSLVE